jgi:hypothetical protein
VHIHRRVAAAERQNHYDGHPHPPRDGRPSRPPRHLRQRLLLVGSEVIEKEAAIFRDVLRNHALASKTTALTVTDDARGKDCAAAANFAKVFESRRKSVRLKHPDGSVIVLFPNE